jgi:hypothetical protein
VQAMNLDQAVVYDIETLPNVFTLAMELLYQETASVWEISHYRDDRRQLIEWFNWLSLTQTPMIGFNNVHFDYPVIHFIYNNPQCTVEQIHAKSQEIINNYNDRFGQVVWERDRFAPQIDLFKIHHFDNKAKTTSLKALQVNMRAPNVRESKLPFDQPVAPQDVDGELIPYNRTDVSETKRFAHYSLPAINFRIGLIPQFGIEALNFNDTKIGEKMLEQRLGEDVCYDRSTGRKQKRQTPRTQIALAEIIFPYIQFNNPEFARVLAFMKTKVLTPEDITDPDSPILTKGVLTGLTANVGGLTFHFGTGGVHASVTAQRFVADNLYVIRDIDVEALYPNVAIVNQLAPEHLGSAYMAEYAKIPNERKTHAKGTYQNAALKLAANGAWGKSNSKFSVFYDPKYAMTIPINGQLMICMLAEWLLTIPTLQIIQVNTDGITYRIRCDYVDEAKVIEQQWQDYTKLKLEDVDYAAMWIRDVNNYIAQDTKGKLKQKGAYWHPDPSNYAESISNASPPCWHKDLGNIISIRAAVAAMVHGIDPETFIKAHTDSFDFMLRAKVDRSSRIILGDRELQRTTRYYVARDGEPMTIERPPAGPEGHYRRKNGNGWQWAEAVCTKNKSRYEKRITAVQAGWKIAECNIATDFRFDCVDYDWYINETKKLIIA